jgi:hypothetical protein
MDTNILEERPSIFRFDHEDAGSVFLIDIGVHLPHHMVSEPGSPQCKHSPLRDSQTLHLSFILTL